MSESEKPGDYTWTRLWASQTTREGVDVPAPPLLRAEILLLLAEHDKHPAAIQALREELEQERSTQDAALALVHRQADDAESESERLRGELAEAQRVAREHHTEKGCLTCMATESGHIAALQRASEAEAKLLEDTDAHKFGWEPVVDFLSGEGFLVNTYEETLPALKELLKLRRRVLSEAQGKLAAVREALGEFDDAQEPETCPRCGEWFNARDGCDPVGECDSCAQAIVAAARTALASQPPAAKPRAKPAPPVDMEYMQSVVEQARRGGLAIQRDQPPAAEPERKLCECGCGHGKGTWKPEPAPAQQESRVMVCVHCEEVLRDHTGYDPKCSRHGSVVGKLKLVPQESRELADHAFEPAPKEHWAGCQDKCHHRQSEGMVSIECRRPASEHPPAQPEEEDECSDPPCREMGGDNMDFLPCSKHSRTASGAKGGE